MRSLLSILSLTSISLNLVSSQQCPAIPLSYTQSVVDMNGQITATFKPASLTPQLVHVQFHVSKNCAQQMQADPEYTGPTPVIISTSSSVCPTTWYQPPFDSISNPVAQNHIAYTNNQGNSMGSSYDAATNTYKFTLSDSPLLMGPGDIICYDFTYDTATASCNTGICNMPTPPTTAPIIIGVKGDPQFTGFQGQSFQVHGISGMFYNIFSSSLIQINSQFEFLSSGYCDKSLRTLCYGHPGSYIGALGLQFKHGNHNKNANNSNTTTTKIEIRSGPYNEGLTLLIDDKEIEPSKEMIKINEHIRIKLNDVFRVSIESNVLNVMIANSDRFLNMDMNLNENFERFLSEANVKRCEWPSSAPFREPHGLMGQTWCIRKMISSKVEGEIDDYAVEDGLFGTDFLYNRF